jgi:hypothetical protein
MDDGPSSRKRPVSEEQPGPPVSQRITGLSTVRNGLIELFWGKGKIGTKLSGRKGSSYIVLRVVS